MLNYIAVKPGLLPNGGTQTEQDPKMSIGPKSNENYRQRNFKTRNFA